MGNLSDWCRLSNPQVRLGIYCDASRHGTSDWTTKPLEYSLGCDTVVTKLCFTLGSFQPSSHSRWHAYKLQAHNCWNTAGNSPGAKPVKSMRAYQNKFRKSEILTAVLLRTRFGLAYIKVCYPTFRRICAFISTGIKPSRAHYNYSKRRELLTGRHSVTFWKTYSSSAQIFPWTEIVIPFVYLLSVSQMESFQIIHNLYNQQLVLWE